MLYLTYNVMTNKIIIIFVKSREHTAYALGSPKISREHTRVPAYHCHYNTAGMTEEDIAKGRRRRDTKGKGNIATLNMGSMAGRGQEVVDIMERRKVNIMCVQETQRKNSKTKHGFKLFYIGEDGRGEE